MSTLSLRLPESLHAKIRQLASEEGVSINQFITLAAAEKVSALLTVDYLRERAEGGSRDAFDAVLSRVPDVAPEESDRLD
jgi:hypothetical protein